MHHLAQVHGSFDADQRGDAYCRSRTGTKTFAQALTTLIGPVHDGGAQGLVGSAEQREQWLQVMRLLTKEDKSLAEKKRLEWLLAELMDGYSAVSKHVALLLCSWLQPNLSLTFLSEAVDAPCIWLVPELLDLYPDAIGK